MSNLPKSVSVIEVGPRDGLQIEPRILSTDDKVRMVDTLVRSGLREVEVGSFVNPKAGPSTKPLPKCRCGSSATARRALGRPRSA